MGWRTQFVRSAATRMPWLARRILRLSARRAIPRELFEHWLGQDVAHDLALDTIGLRWRAMAFEVPIGAYGYYRNFEPETTAAFERLLRPGMVVADIGANVGYTAGLAASLVGPQGHVHAFEPAPATRRLLEQNMKANGFGNVTVHPFIAGDADRPRTFHLSQSSLTNSVSRDAWAPSVSSIELEERRLDGLLSGPIDFAKIDVEGAEVAVLQGMAGLLAQPHATTLIVEWNPISMEAAGRAPMDLPETLRALGFGAITMLDDDNPGVERPIEDAIARLAASDWKGRDFVNLVARRG